MKILPRHTIWLPFYPFLAGNSAIRVFDFVFGTVFGIYHAMDNFTGRTK